MSWPVWNRNVHRSGRPVPARWPTEPHRRAVRDQLPVQVVFWPTYASRLNPIEKRWRWLRQGVPHWHRLSDD
jgi:transposase